MPGPQPFESSSWASSHSPSQLRLRPRTPGNNNDADIEPMDLSKIDDDPISYFLTPTPSLLNGNDPYSAEDPMDFEMDFDAGIEDFKHPPPIIRSVSPSSLEGLSLSPSHHRPPTPPKSPGTPDSSTDMPLTPDDHEDYMRFASLKGSGRSLTFPIRLVDLTLDSSRKSRSSSSSSSSSSHGAGPFLSPEVSAIGSPVRVPSPLSGYSTTTTSPSSSSSSSYSTPVVLLGGAGGVGTVGSSRGRTRTLPPRHRRRSPHAWRQPSPDVWSIEEETQDAIESEIGGGGGALVLPTDAVGQGQEVASEGRVVTRARARALEISAAKPTTALSSSSTSSTTAPRKRVRFVLPVLD